MALLFALLFILALSQLGSISRRSKRLLELCESLKRSNEELCRQLQTLGDRVARIEGAMGLGHTAPLTADESDVAPDVQSDV
ncbi:hypothetical protein [Methylocaldum sp. GT1TLB]|uniref:hypothetical protein n=1 Tax=Methylocaldum sp. GT1TLB TaxID=3438965 RepID=UPI003DA151CA